MKKVHTFAPLTIALLAAAVPELAAASVRDAVYGEPPAGAVRYAVRLAADAPAQVRSVTGVSGKAVPLDIGALAGGAQSYRFVMVRGLPETAALSVGFRVRQAWFVASKDLDDMQVVSAEGYEGSFLLELFFFRDSQEAPAASTMVNVQIAADTGRAPSAVPAATLDDSVIIKPQARPAVFFSPAQESEMLRKGEEYMHMGDIASARLVFEDLAAHGSSKGALAMGQSYDAAFLKDIMIAGALRPSADKARLWYQRAADMGNPDAPSRLAPVVR